MGLTQNTVATIYEYLYGLGRLIGTFARPATSLDELTMGVHEGVSYSIAGYNISLADGTSAIFLGMTGNCNVHFSGFDVTTSAGGWLIELHEAPTVTANGTLQAPINLNFQSTNVNKLTVYAGGTVSANGILKLATHIHAAGTGSANRVSTDSGLRGGMILKRNTTYMIKITNNSGAANAYEATMKWSEK